jgi:myo-inositol-1(or 4)-monophosphatase
MLSPSDLTDALREVTAIAADAATLLLTGYRRPGGGPRVEYKGAVDLVTEFDRRSEERIRERLARSFPGCDIVAEESGGTVRGDRPVFFADPLDGTTNYAHGHPFFAVSIGLWEPDGSLGLGCVVAPALGWTHTAARGQGAMRNDVPCRVSSTNALERSLLATGFPYDRRTSTQNNLRAFVELKRKAQGIRRCGAASLDLCLVADGTYDGYWEHKLNAWDLAAGAMCVLESGGRATNFDGSTLDVHGGHLVVSNGAIHEELLSALAVAEQMEPL